MTARSFTGLLHALFLLGFLTMSTVASAREAQVAVQEQPFALLVVDESRTPIADARVSLRLEFGIGTRAEERTGVTDADGKIEFAVPRFERVDVRVEPGESDRAHHSIRLFLEQGRSFTQVVLPTRRFLKLLVVDAQGEPVTFLDDVRVNARRGSASGLPGARVDSALSARDGRYAIELLPVAGSVSVRSARSGSAEIDYDPARAEDGEERVELGRVGVLRGRITQADSGLANGGVADVRVALMSVWPRNCRQIDCLIEGRDPRGFGRVVSVCTSAADGSYELAVERAGDYALLAESAQRGVGTVKGLRFEHQNEPRVVDVDLREGAHVDVILIDGSERPMANAPVSLWGRWNGVRREGRTDENGRFVAEMLAAGVYEGWTSSLREASVPIEVGEGDGLALRLFEPWQKPTLLVAQLVGESGSFEARLYTRDCEPSLAHTEKSKGQPVLLLARQPGAHVLAVRRVQSGATLMTRLVDVDLALGQNGIEVEMPRLEVELEVLADSRERALWFRQVDRPGSTTCTRLPSRTFRRDPGDENRARGYGARVPIGDGDVIRFDENGEPVVVVDAFPVRADAGTLRVTAK